MNKWALIYGYIAFAALSGRDYENLSKAPVAVAYTPNKPDEMAAKTLLYAGERPRYSSCSGVVFSPQDRYVMSVHLFSGTLSTYEFNKDVPTLEAIRCVGNKDGFPFNHPENLDIYPDGRWVAISQGAPGTVNLFTLDSETGEIQPTDIALRYSNRDWAHGVAFSDDGTFLASTSIGETVCVGIYKIVDGSFQKYQVLETKIRPLEPKGVAFSPDGRFLAACYCQTIGTNKTKDPIAQLEIYKLNPDTQLFEPNPVSVFTKAPGNMETVKFSPDGSYLLTSDQVLDEIFVHEFDRETGALSGSKILLENPTAELNFPHGLAFSRDGKYLAVTNYGDDRITLYQFGP